MNTQKGARLTIFVPKGRHEPVGETRNVNQVTLMHCEIPGIFKPSKEAPAVRIVEIDAGSYDFTVLIPEGLSRNAVVFSGRYAFGEALSGLGFPYPLPIYDVKK